MRSSPDLAPVVVKQQHLPADERPVQRVAVLADLGDQGQGHLVPVVRGGSGGWTVSVSVTGSSRVDGSLMTQPSYHAGDARSCQIRARFVACDILRRFVVLGVLRGARQRGERGPDRREHRIARVGCVSGRTRAPGQRVCTPPPAWRNALPALDYDVRTSNPRTRIVPGGPSVDRHARGSQDLQAVHRRGLRGCRRRAHRGRHQPGQRRGHRQRPGELVRGRRTAPSTPPRPRSRPGRRRRRRIARC